jgi:hypothetical protein
MGVTLSRSEGSGSMTLEMLRCAQHDSAVHLPRPRDCPAQRRILTTNKHAHNKSIAVLKNTAQSERYVGAIQSFIEKGSNSYDFPSRMGSTTCKSKSMKCLTTSQIAIIVNLL